MIKKIISFFKKKPKEFKLSKVCPICGKFSNKEEFVPWALDCIRKDCSFCQN